MRRSNSSPDMASAESVQRRDVRGSSKVKAEPQHKDMQVTSTCKRCTDAPHARTTHHGVSYGKLKRSITPCLEHTHTPRTAKPKQAQTTQSRNSRHGLTA